MITGVEVGFEKAAYAKRWKITREEENSDRKKN